MTTQALDQAKVEAFGGRLIGVLNDASLALMLSVGHQTGLFDTMATLPAATSSQIAEAAGLNERYVREGLGALVTGKVVEYDNVSRTYRLPPEHAAMLTRDAGPNNFASFTQMVAMLAVVEQEIIESFRNGGGVPYEKFPRFHTVMAETSAATYDAGLLNAVLPLVPGLKDRLRDGIDAADICCGSGHAINLLAKEFPASRFTGIDISTEALGNAGAEAERLGLDNARFVLQDAAKLEDTAAYDLITVFDGVHDQVDPERVLRNIARALRPDGVFLMADIAASSNLEDNLDHVAGPFGYTISTMHCMTVSLAHGGAGLGTMWGEQTARRMLAEAGFTQVDVQRAEGDLFNNYYVARR